jgi:hypothetical protein
MVQMIENKVEKKSKEISESFAKCHECFFGERPREGLPPLCKNQKAVGWAEPWNMPPKYCPFWKSRF